MDFSSRPAKRGHGKQKVALIKERRILATLVELAHIGLAAVRAGGGGPETISNSQDEVAAAQANLDAVDVILRAITEDPK